MRISCQGVNTCHHCWLAGDANYLSQLILVIMRFAAVLLCILGSVVAALSPAEWRSQAIYQVITDRFARTDGSTTAECDALMGLYCGGSFQGIISKLDYVQNMGFTAVSINFVHPMGSVTDLWKDMAISRRRKHCW